MKVDEINYQAPEQIETEDTITFLVKPYFNECTIRRFGYFGQTKLSSVFLWKFHSSHWFNSYTVLIKPNVSRKSALLDVGMDHLTLW